MMFENAINILKGAISAHLSDKLDVELQSAIEILKAGSE